MAPKGLAVNLLTARKGPKGPDRPHGWVASTPSGAGLATLKRHS